MPGYQSPSPTKKKTIDFEFVAYSQDTALNRNYERMMRFDKKPRLLPEINSRYGSKMSLRKELLGGRPHKEPRMNPSYHSIN
jgi:hypothetical protein